MTDIEMKKTASPREYIGPYENWIFHTGKDYQHPGLDHDEIALSCVISLPPNAQSTPFSSTSDFYLPVIWQPDGFQPKALPVLFTKENVKSVDVFEAFSTGFEHIFSAKTKFASHATKTTKGTFRTNLPVDPDTINTTWVDEDSPPARKGTSKPIVIVAVIDDGIPFAHRNFCGAADYGTRIDYCWSQSARCIGNEMLFGREFRKSEIDCLYTEYDKDEGAIYRAAKLAGTGKPDKHFPLDKMHSHGAHILDALAGNAPKERTEDQDRVHIIAVDLPAMASADTSGFGKDMFLLAAMHYIFDRADKIAAQYADPDDKVPLIVNLSYGHSAGPHDGTGLVEAAFDDMIKARREKAPTALVMPSGNMYLQSIHAVISDRELKHGKGCVTLDWFVPPNDRTSNYVEIWFPKDMKPDDVVITLTPPKGSAFEQAIVQPPADTAKPHHVAFGPKDARVGQISTELHRDLGWRHVIAIAPTLVDNDMQPAPAGRWTFTIKKARNDVTIRPFTGEKDHKDAGGIQFWVQRDEDFGAAGTGALQSYFIDEKNASHDKWGAPRVTDSTNEYALIRRYGTLSGMATGANTLRVAGYDEQSLAAAQYSCAGSLRYSGKDVISVGPQVAVSGVSERSYAMPGVVAAGTRTGITVALRGTSSAAPQVARAIADVLLKSPQPNDNEINDFAKILGLHINAGKPRNHPNAHPKGPNRLGEFLARKPRNTSDVDATARIQALTQGAVFITGRPARADR